MKYTVKAIKSNSTITRVIEANSENEVLSYLRKNEYIPITITPQTDPFERYAFLFNSLSFNDIVNFTRQLAIMLNAGLTLVDCFAILEKQTTKKPLLELIRQISKEILAGNTFSSALRKHPKYFSNLYIALVRSGEASGKLSEILIKLADNLEKQREFQSKIKGALTYPVIIVVGMVGVMFVMVTFVIPKLLGLYKDFNVELPLSTQILIVVSDISSRFWPLIVLAVAGLITLLQRYLATEKGKYQYDRLLLRLPVFGKIVSISSLVDSTRTLSILIGSGVSILDALSIVIDTTGNLLYRSALKNVYKQVERGFSLGTALGNDPIFPPILVQMASVGEQTGHLDDTTGRISRYFEMESEMAVKTLTTLIEPLILVVLGVGVGFLVISVITPIYNLTSSFK